MPTDVRDGGEAAGGGSPGAPDGTREAILVDLDPRAAAVALATIITLLVAVSVIRNASAVFSLVVLAALVALAVNPIVERIEERLRIRRGFAVAIVCAGVLVVVAVIVVLFGKQTVEQAQSFQDDLPNVVNRLTEVPVVGPVLAENAIPERIREWASQLPRQLAGNGEEIANVAESVTAALAAAAVTVFLAVAMLLDGPRLVRGALWLTPTPARRRVRRFGTIVERVVGRFFAGSLLLAFLQGIVVLVTGLVLGVPLSPLLALWAALWSLVPQVGGAVGGATFVLVAFTAGPTSGLIAAAIFVVYLVFANNVLLPVIIGKSVDISPLTTMVAAITGFSVGGIVGALLAVPILGAAKAMYFELRPWTRDVHDAARAQHTPSRFRRTKAATPGSGPDAP